MRSGRRHGNESQSSRPLKRLTRGTLFRAHCGVSAGGERHDGERGERTLELKERRGECLIVAGTEHRRIHRRAMKGV